MLTAHAAALPLLIPFTTAIIMLCATGAGLNAQRRIGLAACLAGIMAAAWLMVQADGGGILVYAMGNWQAPYGIVLVADRLAALMVFTTAILGGICLLYATQGFDSHGRHFHALFQLQLTGLQGAFLTGDLFNLFVCFEVMLLASYALLGHGAGRERTRAGLPYLVLNLIGSALFLVGLGVLYGALGTLNLADMAAQLAAGPTNAGLVRLAVALLFAVFLLKSAILPLSFWLPRAYAAAGAPVAALFAIMTKVGIVAVLRVQITAVEPAQTTAGLLSGWLVWLALATLAFAAMGMLAAGRLREQAAWLVLASAGTLLVVPALASEQLTAAALFYLVQSTLCAATLFLLAQLIAERRGLLADRFCAGPATDITWLALGFLVVGAALAGLPPSSGFLGKLMLLSAIQDQPHWPVIWTVVLGAGFIALIALARGGSYLFWDRDGSAAPLVVVGFRRALAVCLLAGAGPLMVVLAGPVSAYTARAAAQLHQPDQYIAAVLGQYGHSSIQRERRQ